MKKINVTNLDLYYGKFQALKSVTLAHRAVQDHGHDRPFRAAANPPSCASSTG